MLAHAIRHLADIHRDLGDTPSAESCYREALSLYRDLPDVGPVDLANAIRPLALLLESQGKSGEARSLFEEARGLYATGGVQAGVAECEAGARRCSS